MKIAIFGVWHVHAADYTKTAMELGEVVGFYEENDALAEKFASKFNIPRFSTPGELLKSDAEGVIVCSASSEHADDIIKIAKAGKHIFTEKVLALTDADCDRIETAVNESGVTFVISFFQKYLGYFGLQQLLVLRLPKLIFGMLPKCLHLVLKQLLHLYNIHR